MCTICRLMNYEKHKEMLLVDYNTVKWKDSKTLRDKAKLMYVHTSNTLLYPYMVIQNIIIMLLKSILLAAL